MWGQAYRENQRNKALTESIEVPDEGEILDMSCGAGKILQELYQKNHKLSLYGTDISETVIAEAKVNSPTINFQPASSTDLPFPENKFDIVICSMSLHHYAKLNQTLTELNRVLKINGAAYIMEIFPGTNVSQSIYNLIKCREPYHFEKFYIAEEIISKCSKLDWRLEQSYPVAIIPRIKVLKFKKGSVNRS